MREVIVTGAGESVLDSSSLVETLREEAQAVVYDEGDARMVEKRLQEQLAGKAFTPEMLRRLFGRKKGKSKYTRKPTERKKAPKQFGKRK